MKRTMSQLRDEAEALARALEIGACGVDEVIAWADAQIVRESQPDWPLCEAALSRDRYPQDVAGILRQLPEPFSRRNVNQLLVTLLNARLKGDADLADRVASALYQMALADQIEDSGLKQTFWWARDALDLADAGYIAESRAQVVAEMARALEQAAEEAGIDWSVRVASMRPPA